MYSVLMSIYNKEVVENLQEALNSILFQTIPPSEIIIVKDGKLNKKLEETLENYRKKYSKIIKIVGYSCNKGLGYALNFGLQYCSNKLVARMDTDDIAEPFRCELQLECFNKNRNLDIVGGIIEEFIDDTKNIIGRRDVPKSNEEIILYMGKRCPFNHMTVMFKKESVLKAGGYKDLFWDEDYYLWIRMREIGCKFLNLNKTLVKVRVDNETYKRRGGINYFRSEKYLQDYMLSKKMIGNIQYYQNILLRIILQVLMPNIIRGYIFKKFARKNNY